jgi:hypothetical protein
MANGRVVRHFYLRIGVTLVATALALGTFGAAPASATTTRQIGIAVGDDYQCAVSSTGIVKCWLGSGSGPQDATATAIKHTTGENPDPTTPITVVTGASAVMADDTNMCALLKTSTVSCWESLGYNGDGTTNYAVPVPLQGVNGKGILSGVTALTAGDASQCALLISKTVKCWGQNDYGVLGNGTIKNSTTPVSVTGLRHVTSVSISAQTACASLQNGTVDCWGYDGSNELGVPTGSTNRTCPFGEFSAPCSKIPRPVKGVSGVTSVSASQNHVCAVLKNKSVECWGANSPSPVIEKGLTDVARLVTDGSNTADQTCALLGNGTVECTVGYDTATYKPAPFRVAGLSGVTAVSIGDVSSCAVLAIGTVKCWQESDNNTTTTKPVTVTGL